MQRRLVGDELSEAHLIGVIKAIDYSYYWYVIHCDDNSKEEEEEEKADSVQGQCNGQNVLFFLT